jgi:hypothetical protein
MKRYIQCLFTTLLLFGFLFLSSPAFSQNGDPPPPPGDHGQTGNQPPGGGAAIGGGVLLLAALGAGYGAGKWYIRKKRNLAE